MVLVVSYHRKPWYIKAMPHLRAWQLDLWRQACHCDDVAETARRFMRIVGELVAVEHLWIIGFDHDRSRAALLSSVNASGTTDPVEQACDPAPSQQLLKWCDGRTAEPVHPAKAGRSATSVLANVVGDAPVVACILRREKVVEGIALWKLRADGSPSARAIEVLAAANEPLAAATETSRRFQELTEHRRAAEADRTAALAHIGRTSLSDTIVGADNGLRGVLDRVDIVARSDVPVLLLGETGTGKEVIARALHEQSNRATAPFLRVNCGAIPVELIDTQLFGHERGAFTGAAERRLGWFERADGGTLLLDEIGELSPAAQVRLLRVLQDGVLERVGGQSPVEINVRVIAATHRDLADMVQRRRFREDLWYRVAVFPIVIPPLRERTQDIAALARHFADRASIRFGLEHFDLSIDDIDLLSRYPWPGNIRELAAVIDRAALLGRNHHLALAASLGSPAGGAPAHRSSASGDQPHVATLDDIIRAHIEHALRSTGGRIEGPGGAAELLAVNPHTLRSRMRKLRLDWKRHRRT